MLLSVLHDGLSVGISTKFLVDDGAQLLKCVDSCHLLTARAVFYFLKLSLTSDSPLVSIIYYCVCLALYF